MSLFVSRKVSQTASALSFLSGTTGSTVTPTEAAAEAADSESQTWTGATTGKRSSRSSNPPSRLPRPAADSAAAEGASGTTISTTSPGGARISGTTTAIILSFGACFSHGCFHSTGPVRRWTRDPPVAGRTLRKSLAAPRPFRRICSSAEATQT